MKVALITDTHFGARQDSIQFNDYFFKFWEKQFFPYLRKHKIDTVLHLGDVMDRRKFISYRIAKDFRERFIDKFHEMGITVHMITGNHDCFYKNTNDVNSLNELIDKTYTNIHTYSECETITLKDGTEIFMIPWINVENYAYTLESIKNTSAQIAMGHLEISGFEMNKGHVIKDGYSKDLFNKFDMVMSGHFHKKSDDGHIYYLGNTYEMTWMDYKCPKGFHIFDTEKRELKHIKNKYTMFDVINYNDTRNTYNDVDVSSYKEKYIKLNIIQKKNIYEFDMFVDKLLKESGAYEVKIVESFAQLSPDDVSDDVAESMDTISLLDKYIDELNVDVSKDKLKGLMKKLYLEASELEV